MAVIPLIVGYGGINPAGRSSFDHGFNRTIIDSLSEFKKQQTWQSLRALTNKPNATEAELAASTLVREIEPQYFDHKRIPWNKEVNFETDSACIVTINRRKLPETLPSTWRIVDESQPKVVKVAIEGMSPTLVPDYRECEVGAAGQVPTGFDPSTVYQSRSHPRGVQLGVYSSTDALGSMGIDWATIEAHVKPDQISVYNGSCLSQLDADGVGGLFSRANGKRVSSKNLALGMAQMPADFMNAYVFGSVGTTGLVMGACATFHYNLRAAVQDISSGKCLVALVGGSESGLSPEVIDGFYTMGALGTKKGLSELDGGADPDYRRACRPFGENCGFTISESAQTVILMADELALKLGAQVFGSVPEVFVNADGFKKSISGPGVGNHITVAKSAALIRSLLGDKGLQQHSFVHAHGTGTPQNRVTESQIFSQVAGAFGIEHWPVAAIKCYLGHTLATAGGDQLISAIGTWNSGVLPGISTIDRVADDVHTDGLDFCLAHRQFEPNELQACLLNAKGFGGNNATSVVLSPGVTENLLLKKHGSAELSNWKQAKESTIEHSLAYESAAMAGNHNVVYKFDNNVRDGAHIHISKDALSIDGYVNSIDLSSNNPLLSIK